MDDDRFQVLPARHEIMFRDGSTVGLHMVHGAAGPDTYLRAVPGGDVQRYVIDLRRVAPELAKDMPTAPRRDIVGLVFYTLRQRFPNAGEFMAAVRREGRAEAVAA